MPELILASTSPYRRRMLEDAGFRVRAEAPEVSEDAPSSVPEVAQLVCELATRKARAVADRHPSAWVIGADQLAFFPDQPRRPIGKPADAPAHLAMLQEMRGRAHVLVTGLAVVGPGVDHVSSHQTVMHVRGDLTDEELGSYVATEEGRYCAAGYAAEARGAFLFSRIEGDFFNVQGLPVLAVIQVLRELGWRFDGG